MKESIFSDNEVKYLSAKDDMEEEYNKNYIYQLRHSIKKKIAYFVYNDLDLLINFDDILDDKVILDLTLKLIKSYPVLIKRILDDRQISKIRQDLGF